MSVASGSGSVAKSSQRQELHVQKHVNYIKSLDTVRDSGYHSTSLHGGEGGLTTSIEEGRPGILAHRAPPTEWGVLGLDCIASARPS